MRTTIELKPERRAKLVAMAAKRGEKGFSSVIAEAIDAYFDLGKVKNGERRKVLSLRGTLRGAQAKRLEREVAKLRGFWR